MASPTDTTPAVPPRHPHRFRHVIEGLFFETKVTNLLDVVLAGSIEADVPFQQTLEFPLAGHYDADVTLKADVPVEFTVSYQGILPVDTIADIEADLTFRFQNVKEFRKVPIQAKLPMKFDLPVNLTVPVKDTIALVYDGPLGMEFVNTSLTVLVDTVLRTRLPIDTRASMPVLSTFGMDITFPRHPVPLLINHADLRLRLSTLRFQSADDPSLPRRRDEPPARPAARARYSQ